MKTWGWAVVGITWLAPITALAGDTSPVPDGKSRPDSIVFAGIAWRMPVDEAARQLAEHGFKESRDARSRESMAAQGRLFESFAMVHGRLDDQGRVVAWDITIPSKGEREEYDIQRKVYDDLVTEMIERYGRRHQTIEKYRFPYSKGDGNTARGIRQGYITTYSEWSAKNKDRLQVLINTDMSVMLAYESRWWNEVDAARRHKKAKDL